MNVTVNIKAIREGKRLSQAEVARRMDTSPEFYFRLEKRNNKLSLEQIESIARALEVSVAELIGISNADINSDEIKRLLGENEELKEKGQALDRIRSSYLKVFNDHITGVRNEIVLDDNKYNLSILDKRFFLETEKAAFCLFLNVEKAEWYELAVKSKLIIDEQIVGYWERFKFLNPLYFTPIEKESYESLIPNTNDDSDRSIEMIRYRAKSDEYIYLDKEVSMMIDWYQMVSTSSSKGRMRTKSVYSRLGVSPASDIGRGVIEKLKEAENSQNDFIDSDRKDGSGILEEVFQKLRQESMEEFSKKIDEEFERLKSINGQ